MNEGRRRRTTAWALLAALLLGGATALVSREVGHDPIGAARPPEASAEGASTSPGATAPSATTAVATGQPLSREVRAVTSAAVAASAHEGASTTAAPAVARERSGRPTALDAEAVSATGLVVTVVDDETGAPVADALVQHAAIGDPEIRSERTDARGRVTIASIEPGPHRLSCRRPGYAGLAFDERILLVAPDEPLELAIEERHLTGGLHLRLLRGPTIAGRVVDLEDRPVSTRVVASSAWGAAWVAGSGQDGRFRITGIGEDLPARLHVLAESPGLGRGEVAVTLTSDAFVVEVVIRLGPPCALEGAVLGPDGTPRPDATVEAHPPDRDAQYLPDPNIALDARVIRGSLDPVGRFRLEGLAPGPVDLLVGAPGLGTAIRRGVVARPGVEWIGEVRLEEGRSISGRVVDARGRPVTQAASLYAHEDGGHEVRSECDEEGRFRFTGLRDVPYEVLCLPAGSTAQLSRRVQASSGEEVDFVVPETFNVILRVETEPARAPVRRVDAMMISEGVGGIGWAGLALADGTFEIGEVAAGTTRIELTFAEYPRLFLERPEPGPDGVCRATVRCVAGGTVRGRAVDERGRPLARAWVEAGASARLDPSYYEDVLTDEEGRFRLPNVPPGAHFVGVNAVEVDGDGEYLARRTGVVGPFTVAKDVEVDLGEIVARPETQAPPVSAADAPR